jgi:lactoylglutathione lyase
MRPPRPGSDDPTSERRQKVIEGVNQVLLEVEDQDRALEFWTEAIGFEHAQDVPYGERERWLEVRTRDKAVTLVLSLRRGEGPATPRPAERPTSCIFFYCDDLPGTYKELRARGVEFSQPPCEQSWGLWSMFDDQEGNRFALVPSEAASKGEHR